MEYRYDGANRLGRADYPYVSTAGSQGNEGSPTNYSYDALGRVVDITDDTGIDTHYSYFLNDTKVTVNPPPAGENSKRRQIEYDVLGHPTSVCEVITGSGTSCGQHSSANGYITTYQYDLLGNLTSVIQSGQGRAFTYDGLSRMLSEANPENGTTYYTYDTDGTCGTHAGDEVKRVDAATNVTCYTWDGLHRLTKVSYPSGPNTANMPNKNFFYDNPSPFGLSAGYYLGRLTGASTSLGTNTYTAEVFSYDPRGLVTHYFQLTPHSTNWYHTELGYFANGATQLMQGFIGTGGSPAFTDLLTYNVDRKGRPYSAVDTTTEQYPHVWPSTAYNAANQPTQVNLVRSSESESFSYDGNSGRMTQWSSVAGSNNQTGNLTWNANGTLYQLAITDTADSGNNQTCTNMYDDLERLSQNFCSGSPGWSQSFTYDAFGNIKTGNATFTPSYASNNRVLPSSGFSYDGMGNVTQDEMYNYSYDAEGRPITISGNGIIGVQITYDAFGRAVEQYNNNNDNAYTQTVYSPNGSLYAIMNGTTVQKYFVPLAAGMQAIYNGSGLQYYRYSDWLGSNRLSITPAGSVYFDGAYAPFAENYAGIGTSDRVFTGQPMDTAPHLYDFPFREYSQDQGRWNVPDPAGLSAVDTTNPQTWNRYAYVGNNPLSNADPQGLYGCSITDYLCNGGSNSVGSGAGGSVNYGGGYTITSGFGGNLANQEAANETAWLGSGSIPFYNVVGNDLMVLVGSTQGYTPNPNYDPNDPNSSIGTFSDTPLWADLGPATGEEQQAVSNVMTGVDTSSGFVRGIRSLGQNPVSPVITHVFGTHWCGVGGAGAPTNNLDVACLVHDACYAAFGLSAGDNWWPNSSSAINHLNYCNQQLCSHAQASHNSGYILVSSYFKLVAAGFCEQ